MSDMNGFDPSGPNLQVSYTDLQTVKDTTKNGEAEVIVKLIQKSDDQSRPGHKVSFFKINIYNVNSDNFNDKVNDKIIGELIKISILYKLGEKNGLKQIDVNLDSSKVVRNQEGTIKESYFNDKLVRKSQYIQLNNILKEAESRVPGICERFENKKLDKSDINYLKQKNPGITGEFIQKYQGRNLQAKIDEWFLLEQKAERVRENILGVKQNKSPDLEPPEMNRKQEESDAQIIEIRQLIEIANPEMSSSNSPPSPKPEKINVIIRKVVGLNEDQIEKLTLRELMFIIKIHEEQQDSEYLNETEDEFIQKLIAIKEEKIRETLK